MGQDRRKEGNKDRPYDAPNRQYPLMKTDKDKREKVKAARQLYKDVAAFAQRRLRDVSLHTGPRWVQGPRSSRTRTVACVAPTVDFT